METDFHVWLGAARHAGKSLLIQDLRGRDGKRAGKQPELPKETLTQKKQCKARGCTQQLNACLVCTGPGFDPKHHNREEHKTTAQLRKCFFFFFKV